MLCLPACIRSRLRRPPSRAPSGGQRSADVSQACLESAQPMSSYMHGLPEHEITCSAYQAAGAFRGRCTAGPVEGALVQHMCCSVEQTAPVCMQELGPNLIVTPPPSIWSMQRMLAPRVSNAVSVCWPVPRRRPGGDSGGGHYAARAPCRVAEQLACAVRLLAGLLASLEVGRPHSLQDVPCMLHVHPETFADAW